MTQENLENPSAENPGTKAVSGSIPMDKAVWSSPTLTRLDGNETQGMAPPGSKGTPAKQHPEEMVFFGS